MTRNIARSQRGFSLIELLVAFSILAMSLGLIYKSMAASARNVNDLGLHQQASMLAESLLATRDSVTDQGWNESGTHALFEWQVSSKPYASAVDTPGLLPLHEILVVISWRDGDRHAQLEVQTLLPQRKPLPGEVIR